MKQLIEAIFEQLDEHWVKFVTAGLFMLTGWYLGKRREKKNWEKREFFDRLNVSLNIIADGKLKIRTLMEKPCQEVFLNQSASLRLLKYAQQTKPGYPLIPIPEDDCWYYTNAVLNEISEKFANGILYQDNQLPCASQTYLFCLTNEMEGDVKTRKIRAMLIRKNLLLQLPESCPQLERPHHRVRWETLMHMAKMYQESPHYFREVELTLPLSQATAKL